MRKKENFYRICTAIVDHGKDALVMLLQNDLEKRNESFDDFIKSHQHEIHHLCYNRRPCCHCAGGAVPTGTPVNRVLYPTQLAILLDTKHKCNCRKVRNGSCFSPAKQGLTVRELDFTLLRCLLVNFVPDYQTQSYCTARNAVDDLTRYRNTLYGHAESGEIDDVNYKKNITDISKALLTIADFCGKKAIMEEKLNRLNTLPYNKELEVTLLGKLQQINDNSKEIEVLKRKVSNVGVAQDELVEGGNKVLKRLDSIEQETAESRRIAEESRRRAEESHRTIAAAAVGGTIIGGAAVAIGRRLLDRWYTPSTSKDDSS